MALEESIRNFNSQIDDCLQTSIEELLESGDWGKINFLDAESEIQKLFDMLNHFLTLPVELLPEVELTKLSNALTPLQARLVEIRDFSIDGANPTGQQEAISTHIKTETDAFYTSAHLWIPYLAYQKGDVQRNISELNSSVKQANQVLENTKEEAREKSEEINDIVQVAKEASASVGVGHFTSNFSGEADKLEKTAATWLKTTIGLAFFTFLATIGSYLLLSIPNEATAAQIVQVLSTKLIIIVVFLTATLWTGKIYKALMHQVSVNKHRANSLLTFQAFIKASNDPNTRDAVLLETTRSIFTLASSGFIDGSTSEAKNTNVVEIIKNSTDAIGKVNEG